MIGCVQSTPPLVAESSANSPQPLAYVAASAPEAISQLIVAERQGAAARDLELLAQLWAPDARITDGRSSADTFDDYVWEGRAAILDRYIMAVFSGPPPPLRVSELASMSVTVEGEYATATNEMDQWTFLWRDGRWWILGLCYNQWSGEEKE